MVSRQFKGMAPLREFSDTSPIPALLCHPIEQPIVSRRYARCPRCGSFWDVDSCARQVAYAESYPTRHMHFEPQVGRLKVMTLQRWLSYLKIEPRRHVICEVGFGGGFCLAYLSSLAREVYGLEAVPLNLPHAATLGVPASHLFLFDERPQQLSNPVSLWLFQDSFEHILELSEFLPWVVANSTADALALIVSPNASSWSCRFLGPFWPHKLPEHLFHWSPEGMIQVWETQGFDLVQHFPTTKRVSSYQLVNHFSLMSSLTWVGPLLRRLVPSLEGWFNIGEMGVLFRRGQSGIVPHSSRGAQPACSATGGSVKGQGSMGLFTDGLCHRGRSRTL